MELLQKLKNFLPWPRGWGSASQRFWEVDALRGVAIVMMTIYHAAWDLSQLAYWSFGFWELPWRYFQVATATLFICLAGVSLTLHRQPAPQKNFFHGFKIFAWGMVVTLGTYFFAPDSYVRFGVLHLIGFSIMLSYPFLRFRWFNLGLGIAILTIHHALRFWGINLVNPLLFDWLGLSTFAYPSFDFFPVFPWFGVVLIGIFLGNVFYSNGARRYALPEISAFPLIRFLQILGVNSLLVYMIHQPIILLVLLTLGIVRF